MSGQRGGEVPWQEFLQAVPWVISYALEHIPQIEFRLESIELLGAK
jgi:hypothetical protein